MGEDADVEITTDRGFGTDGIVILGDGDCANPSSKAGTGAAVGVSATAAMKRAGSGLSLSHPDQAESFPVLFEICGRVVVDFVLLQKGVPLRSRFETSSRRSWAAVSACDRYASSASLSSAARGRSFHLHSSRCAMSSGSSNLICIGERPSIHYLKMRCLRPRSTPDALRWTLNHQIVWLLRHLPLRQRRLAAPARAFRGERVSRAEAFRVAGSATDGMVTKDRK